MLIQILLHFNFFIPRNKTNFTSSQRGALLKAEIIPNELRTGNAV